MAQHTALYAAHQAANAKIVDFAGWDMPLNYGSQLNEHHQVRQDAGVFDVSHMTVVDLQGSGSEAFLQHLLANDVARLKEAGKALYSCMLNENGGVVDDLIVYFKAENAYRIVVNAGTREKDLAWMGEQIKAFDATLTEQPDIAMLAVQGPNARSKTIPLLPADLQDKVSALEPFFAAWNDAWFIGRTGYTGEDGFEVMLPNADAESFWNALLAVGVKPIGLGARDSLRLEAGMCLYGTDMDDSITPLETGLKWTVAWKPLERDFMGRTALAQQKADGIPRQLVGLVLQDKGVLRGHQKITVEGLGDGEITSGTFSPTLGFSIALARIPAGKASTAIVHVRNKQLKAKIVKPVFVRHGKALVNQD